LEEAKDNRQPPQKIFVSLFSSFSSFLWDINFNRKDLNFLRHVSLSLIQDLTILESPCGQNEMPNQVQHDNHYFQI